MYAQQLYYKLQKTVSKKINQKICWDFLKNYLAPVQILDH